MDKIKKLLPLLLIIAISLTIAVKNITPNTYFTGWDNIHPEFNLPQYAKRVFFGAWLEYQGMGGPAAQGHLAEIPRLPIVFILKLLVPDNLNRYCFIFFMYLVGGVGMYWYLTRIWLNKTIKNYRNWIACIGAVYYLLNIVTLQQFYISFEMFTVQFAFFPFLLISIHEISERFNKKTVLKFILIQLLIAPSAHTPTVFYLAASFSFIYVFFVNLNTKKNIGCAIKFTLIIILLTLFANAYWIFPNFYYLFHNAQYVKESIANQLFDLEQLWSVREAGSWTGFLTNIHYIFSWKDFNFATLKHEYIFQGWNQLLAQPLTTALLISINLFSLFGFISTFFDFSKGKKRWGLAIIFFLTTVIIWMGVFLPANIFRQIYSFRTVQQAFRNPFTKLSIIYSFVLSVMLTQFVNQIVYFLNKNKIRIISNIIPTLFIFLTFLSILYISLPSFTGSFINSKLKVTIPNEYFEMSVYLNKKPVDERVLELPFFSQDGWSYYNWSGNSNINGYQGIGFYFFGFPQPFITPDFARWTETTDFFYTELKQALNNKNSSHLKELLDKYRVDIVIVDKTTISQYLKNYSFYELQQLLQQAGFNQVWKKNFLSVYEKTQTLSQKELIIPKQLRQISGNLNRLKRDYAFENVGDYIITSENQADVLFPYIDLTTPQINNITFENNKITSQRQIPRDNYTVKIPGFTNNNYSTVAEITYDNQIINIIFPKTQILIASKTINLSQLDNISVKVANNYPLVYLSVNNQKFIINKGQTIYPVITIEENRSVEIIYSGSVIPLKNISDAIFIPLVNKQVNWDNLKRDVILNAYNINSIKIYTEFPSVNADFSVILSENCSQPVFGKILTQYNNISANYFADDYGVNCSHYVFDNFTPNSSYLMQITGENMSGRSIKFFINPSIYNVIQDEHLMPEKKFQITLGIPAITNSISDHPYSINWETRSFGQLSYNRLSQLKIAPFPIERLSQIQFNKINSYPFINKAVVVNEKKFFNFLHFINVDCKNNPCYIGIDQAYDDLWIALDKNLRILPHFRYNNWANIWQVDGSQKITVVYIPQIVSSLCLILLISGVIHLVFTYKREGRKPV